MTDDLISRQQAIAAIEQHRIAVLEGHKWDEGIEYGYAAAHRHLVDIIENLPFAQPETNCSEIPNNSDTISRQAVTKFLNDWLSCLFENCHKQSASDLKMIIKDFKNLPSAQPERKTGRWITDDSELGIKCNKCGKSFSDYVNAGTEYIFLEEIPNFCPNCGAVMKEGEQE